MTKLNVIIWSIFLLGPNLQAEIKPRPDPLVWRTKEDRVDARIDGWSLHTFLEHLVATTGWRIYVEPDTDRNVTATFTNLTVSEALRRLLGNLNYALLPQTNGPAKFFVFRTSVQEATRLIEPPLRPLRTEVIKDQGRLANELVVSLKPGSKMDINRLARELGARVVGRAEGLNAYRLEFENAASAEAGRSALEDNPEIDAVDNNYVMAPPTRTDALALSSGFPLNLKPAKSSDKVVVGLIDTAVQSRGTQIEGFLLPSLTVSAPSEPPVDQPTHGTSMAETILRGLSQLPDAKVETSVRILPVDVYGQTENTTTFEVAKGIAAAVQAGATVVNLSLGGPGDSDFLHQVIQAAHNQGVVFLAGAGNEPTATPFYPAAYPEVIAVTAGDKRGNIAPYASRGSFVDAIAPGTSLVQYNGQVYLVTGTSASTAYLSGIAAGLAADKTQTPTQIEQQIRSAFAPKPPATP